MYLHCCQTFCTFLPIFFCPISWTFISYYLLSAPISNTFCPLLCLSQWHHFQVQGGHWGKQRELPRILSPCLSAHQLPHPLPSSLCPRRTLCASPFTLPLGPISLDIDCFRNSPFPLHCHLCFCVSNGYYLHNYMLLFLSILKTISFSLVFHSHFNPATMLLRGASDLRKINI